MLEDIIRDTRFYKKILQEGRQEGLERGKEEGRQEGVILGLCEAIITIVLERFPAIADLVQQRIEHISDPALLRQLNAKMAISQKAEEAEQYLREAEKGA